ncbi:MAG: methyltransferase domain-containing protein [Planctomycetes bacterium]|nr:methyltransferase domain-containing protein [Planctomycetota bacterium]
MAEQNPQVAFTRVANLWERYVDWDQRMQREMPRLISVLKAHQVSRVIDAGCGTGHHMVELAKSGFTVVGTDADPSQLDVAESLAMANGFKIPLYVSTFEDLNFKESFIEEDDFDAVLCLGNSLSLVKDAAQIQKAFENFRKLLTSSGVVLCHLVNLERIMERNERFAPIRTIADEPGGKESIILKFFAHDSDGYQVHLVELEHAGDKITIKELGRVPIVYVPYGTVVQYATEAGFELVGAFSGQTDQPFDPAKDLSYHMILRVKKQV